MTDSKNTQASPMPEVRRLPPVRTADAWFGIDSLNGRFLFGSGETQSNGMVASGQTISIASVAHAHFRAERLFVRRQVSSDFLIRSVFVGAQNASPINQRPVIAEPFAVDTDRLTALEEAIFSGMVLELKINKVAAEAMGAPWSLPAIQPGMCITVEVENIGDRPHRFLGAFYGKALF